MAKAFDVNTAGTLETSLLAWYNLESSSVDEFGTNDGTDTSMSYAAGLIGNAGSFNGTTSYISRASFTPTFGSFSISAWIKPSSTTGERDIVMFRKTADSNPILGMFIFGGNLYFRLRSNAGTGIATINTTATISTANWTHVVATYNGGTNAMNIYLNNSGDGSGSYSGGTWANATDFHIGYDTVAAPANTFVGLIDNVGLWTKVLSAQEISDLYNSGNGNAYREQAVAYVLAIAHATYTVTAQTISLLRNARLAIAHATYTIAAQAISFVKGRGILIAHASYVITATAINFVLGKGMLVAHATFSLTGQTLTLLKGKTIYVGTAIYSATVSRVKFYLNGLNSIYSRKFPAQGTTYTRKFEKKGTKYEQKYPS